MLKVCDIRQDEYGCEDRPDDWEPQVMVALIDEEGSKHWVKAADSKLTRLGIGIGSTWPENIDEEM